MPRRLPGISERRKVIAGMQLLKTLFVFEWVN
jgi:hypothetical protein